MEEQVFEFVEELKVNQKLSNKDAQEMRATLIEQMKINVDPKNAALFLSTLKGRMESADNSIFTGNGINVEIVKTIAITVAKNVEKVVKDRREKEEQYTTSNISNTLKDDLANIEEKTLNIDKDGYQVPDFMKEYGLEKNLTKEEWEYQVGLAKIINGRAEIDENPDFNRANNNQEAKINVLAKELFEFTNNYLKDNPDADIDFIREQFFSKIKNLSSAEKQFVIQAETPVIESITDYISDDLNIKKKPNEIEEELGKKYPAILKMIPQEKLSSVVGAVHESVNKSFLRMPKGFSIKKMGLLEKLKFLEGAFQVASDILKTPARMSAAVRLDKNMTIIDSSESALDRLSKSTKLFWNSENCAPDVIIDNEQQYDRIRTNKIKAEREIIEALEKDPQIPITEALYYLKKQQKYKPEKREILVDKVLNEYFKSDKSLVELFNEIPREVIEANDLLFEDLLNKIVSSEETRSSYGIKPTISGNEMAIYELTNEIAVYNKIVDRLKKEDPKANEAKIKEYEKEIKVKQDQIYIDHKKNKEFKQEYIRTATYQKFKNKCEKEESQDYAGKYEDVIANRTLEDRISLIDGMINDRNFISKLSKELNLSEDEAAKKYFQKFPEKLEKYSNKMQNLINGQDNDNNFDLDKIDLVIMYHNGIIKQLTLDEKNNLERKNEEIMLYSGKIEFQVEHNKKFEECNELLLKCENLENALNKDNRKIEIERQNNIKMLIGKYFSSADMNVSDIFSYMSEKQINNIPKSEFMKYLKKAADEMVPGSGDELIKIENELLKYKNENSIIDEMLEKAVYATEEDKNHWIKCKNSNSEQMELKRGRLVDYKGKYIEKNGPIHVEEVKEEFSVKPLKSLNMVSLLEKKGVTMDDLLEQANVAMEIGRDVEIKDKNVDALDKKEESR